MFLRNLLATMAPEGASGTGTASPAPASSGAPAAGAADQPAASQTTSQTKPTRPEGLEDKFWDGDKGVKWDDLNGHLKQLSAFKAEADIKAQGVPTDANGYAFTDDDLPKELRDKGVKVKADDPEWQAARSEALKAGLTKEQFKALATFNLSQRVQRETDFATKSAEALKPLGDAKDTRINAVKTALTGRLGKAAEAITPLLFSAPIVEAFESLLRQTPAAAPGAGAGTTEAKPDWNKLSPLAKFAAGYDNAARNKQRAA